MPLTVQTFPSGVQFGITVNNWYTAKLRIIPDNVEVYIHGGQEGYNNQLLGTGPHSGIVGSIVRFNANIAATPASQNGLFTIRNYFVTDTLNFTPPSGIITSSNLSFLTKEKFSR